MLTDPRICSDIVTVLVGPNAKKFYIHEGTLTSSSPFFEAALKKRMEREPD